MPGTLSVVGQNIANMMQNLTPDNSSVLDSAHAIICGLPMPVDCRATAGRIASIMSCDCQSIAVVLLQIYEQYIPRLDCQSLPQISLASLYRQCIASLLPVLCRSIAGKVPV